MISSPQRLVLLLPVLFSLASCRAVCRPRSQTPTISTSPLSSPNISTGPTDTTPDQNGTSSTPAGKLPFLSGVNMPGFEFGLTPDGSLTGGGNVPPPLEQIEHFLGEHMNVLRFPVGWQYIQNKVNGELNDTELAVVDKYVQETTKQGGYFIFDLHNFARRDGQIVTADVMVDVWTRLAKHYMNQPMVIFGLANEPHDVVTATWIDLVQQVVTAIRKAGAQNYILLPGNNWCHFKSFVEDYNAGMGKVKNPDGSFIGLLFDLHQYFDGDESGTSKECSVDHVDKLTEIAALLKKDGRQAVISEFGGGNSESCKEIITKFVTAAHDNYPAISGVAIWAAGSFAADYTLIVAIKEGNEWKDQININAMKAALGES